MLLGYDLIKNLAGSFDFENKLGLYLEMCCLSLRLCFVRTNQTRNPVASINKYVPSLYVYKI